jgi:hypothetical protein
VAPLCRTDLKTASLLRGGAALITLRDLGDGAKWRLMTRLLGLPLEVVIQRELNSLKYERPAAWFRYLNDRVKLGCPTDEPIERLTEAKASRDILAHNRGLVNET